LTFSRSRRFELWEGRRSWYMLPYLPIHQVSDGSFAHMEMVGNVLIAPALQFELEGFLYGGFRELAGMVIVSFGETIITHRICHVLFACCSMDVVEIAAGTFMTPMSSLEARRKRLIVSQLPGNAVCTDRYPMDFRNTIACINDNALKGPATIGAVKAMLTDGDFAPKCGALLRTAPVGTTFHRAKTGSVDSGMMSGERLGTFKTDKCDNHAQPPHVEKGSTRDCVRQPGGSWLVGGDPSRTDLQV
jgi:hypothetical protein